MKHVGRSVARPEADRFLAGNTRTAADIELPRCLHMRLVRSTVPFGRILSIDTKEAAALPGVTAVWTAKDLNAAPLPIRILGSEALDPYRQPLLAVDQVRYAGEPVAAVFAQTAALAEDAAELVAVDIEPADATLDPCAPATVLSGDLRATEATTIQKGFGDLTLANHNADRVIERRFSVGRDAALPLLPRVSLASWCPAEETLTVWAGWRAVEETRAAVADALRLPLTAVEVRAADIAASYGAGAELSAEDLIVSHAAKAFARPVRWLEDRTEQIAASPQTPGIEAIARAAITDDGTLLALDVEFWCDQGAYILPDGLVAADLFASTLPGPYALKAYRAVGHVRVTNKPPGAAMRGAGRVAANFVRERLVDAVAHTLGAKQTRLRRQNFVSPEVMPVDRHLDALQSRVVLHDLRVEKLLDMAQQHFSLGAAHRRADDRRARGLCSGVGVAVFVEPSGHSQHERVRLSVDQHGGVDIATSAADWGQGTDLALAQIAADILGVEADQVRVRGGRTGRIDHGGATMLAGRTAVTGTAVQIGAEDLREKILGVAARILGVAATRLAIRAGRIREADKHFGKQLDLADVARATAPGMPFADPGGAGLVAEGWSAPDAMAQSCGIAIATIEIDPQTGLVRVPRAHVAYDAGNVINPQLVEDQIVSGVVQATASALTHRISTAPTGQPISMTLSTAGLAGAADRPAVDVLLVEETPTPLNPLGIKGVGAAGVVGMGAAIAQGIDNALDAPGFVRALPVPAREIRAYLRRQRAARLADAPAQMADVLATAFT